MNSWSRAFQVAAVYVGTVVGTGFATGKEIVEFFSRFGFIGFLTILISGYFFITLGTSLMVMAIDLKARSYEELTEYLFGSRFAKGVNLMMLIMLLGFCIVMLSGAGAVFEEQLQLPKLAGILITVALIYIVVIVGTKGLFAVNLLVVPLMILFNILLMMHAVKGNAFLDTFFIVPEMEGGWKAFIYPFIYPAMNLAMAQAVLVPLAAEINDKDVVKKGGMLGGVILTLILISSHLTLITLPNLEMYDIPMAAVMKEMMTSFYLIYIIVIYGEIYTSLIGNIYGLERQLSSYIQAKRIWISTFIILIIFSLSMVDYSTLLTILYPLFGYVSLLFFILLWIKSSKWLGRRKIN